MIKFSDPMQQHIAVILVKRMFHFIANELEDDGLLELSIAEFKEYLPEVANKITSRKRTEEKENRKFINVRLETDRWEIEYDVVFPHEGGRLGDRLTMGCKFFNATLECDKIIHLADSLVIVLSLCDEEAEVMGLASIIKGLSNKQEEDRKRKMTLQ